MTDRMTDIETTAARDAITTMTIAADATDMTDHTSKSSEETPETVGDRADRQAQTDNLGTTRETKQTAMVALPAESDGIAASDGIVEAANPAVTGGTIAEMIVTKTNAHEMVPITEVETSAGTQTTRVETSAGTQAAVAQAETANKENPSVPLTQLV